MNQLICDAITRRCLLSVWWQGGTRIVQPHAYGINTKGNPMMRCWQVSGHSRSGKVQWWKPLLVNEARDFEILDETFEPHHEYRMNDKHMTQIYCQIEL